MLWIIINPVRNLPSFSNLFGSCPATGAWPATGPCKISNGVKVQHSCTSDRKRYGKLEDVPVRSETLTSKTPHPFTPLEILEDAKRLEKEGRFLTGFTSNGASLSSPVRNLFLLDAAIIGGRFLTGQARVLRYLQEAG